MRRNLRFFQEKGKRSRKSGVSIGEIYGPSGKKEREAVKSEQNLRFFQEKGKRGGKVGKEFTIHSGKEGKEP